MNLNPPKLIKGISKACFPAFVLLISMCAGLVEAQASFNSKRTINLPTGAPAVAAGDLNNDGIPDLIVGRYPDEPDRGNLSILLGKGNGTFQAERKVIVGLDFNAGETAPYITDIAVADFNHDNRLDIVVSHNESYTIINFNRFFTTVLLGNGDGTFSTRYSYYFTLDSFGFLYPNSLAVGDFDLDGDIDVYACGGLPGSIGMLYPMMNLGNGTFQVTAPQLLGLYVRSVAVADFKPDGKLDVVVATPRGVVVVYGAGNLYFSAAEQKDATRDENKVVVNDFNRDGKPDFAVIDGRRTEVRVFINSENGFPDVPKTLFMKADISQTLITGDFDGDRIPDLAVTYFRIGKVRVLYGRGDGSFRRGDELSSGLLAQELVASDLDSDGKTDLIAVNAEAPPSEQVDVFLNSPNPKRYYSDFDGDGKADLAVYRPGTGVWWILQSKDLTVRQRQLGNQTDALAPGNYDGDNKADLAVFRDGLWYFLQSSDNSLKVQSWGAPGDVPVPADYNNDGVMDFAVFRPSTGSWHVLSSAGMQSINWGQDGDEPVATDYDGDGRADVAVYRPSNHTWYLLLSANNQTLIQTFGDGADQPVPADYDGDGRTDIAVYRPGAGVWNIQQSSDDSVRTQLWGTSADVPAPKDYDGDGKTDIAVFRPSNGGWYIMQSTAGFRAQQFGTNGDVPVE
ncbi:MAG TPA: VCBS repeat-containing protein [Pyrinomonadaceae bacterium]|jgi:hypothetical protein